MTGGEWEAVAFCGGLPIVSLWWRRLRGTPEQRRADRVGQLVDRQQEELRWRQQVNLWRQERGWPVLDVTDNDAWRREDHGRTVRRDPRPKGMR